MMNYEKFKEEVLKEVTAKINDPDVSTCIISCQKNNNLILHGIQINKKDLNISPVIYLEGHYKDYCSGKSLEQVSMNIINIYRKNMPVLNIDTEAFFDYGSAKYRIVPRLINTKQNKERLSQLSHIDFLDLSIVFAYIMDTLHSDGMATALVTESMRQSWGVSADELYETALKNMMRLLPPKVTSMGSLIGYPGTDIPLYILSNDTCIGGAASILLDDVLKDISRRFNCGFYILPSSIHEVLLLPEIYTDPDKIHDETMEELKEMVNSVNSEVDQEEILSDHAYYYDMKTGKITM